MRTPLHQPRVQYHHHQDITYPRSQPAGGPRLTETPGQQSIPRVRRPRLIAYIPLERQQSSAQRSTPPPPVCILRYQIPSQLPPPPKREPRLDDVQAAEATTYLGPPRPDELWRSCRSSYLIIMLEGPNVPVCLRVEHTLGLLQQVSGEY